LSKIINHQFHFFQEVAMSFTTQQSTSLPPRSSVGGAVLPTTGTTGANGSSSPSISGRVINAVSGLWQGFKGYSSTTQTMGQLTEKVVQISGTVAYYGIVSFDEMFDFANFGGTKDPLASIKKSQERLVQHDQSFERCLNFCADQAAQYYIRNEGNIEKQVNKLLGDGIAASVADIFLDMSKNLIAQTIKANILHLAANLADEAFDRKNPFADRRQNPFGRLLSVIGNCLADYENRLDAIAQLPEDEKTAQYPQVFKEISSALLSKLFPHGAEDIQLFHHTIPIKWVKELVWNKINQELPPLLERFYRETRPLNVEDEDWKEYFDEVAEGLDADQLLELPSTLIQRFVRDDRSRILDAQIPTLEKLLKENGVEQSQAKDFSRLLVKYAKEFLQTDEPTLHQMGAFFERYLMEHLLFNLSQFVPNDLDEETPLPLYILQHWIKGNVFKMLSSKLSGTALTLEDKKKATDELLSPFGFNREESFPLPPMIKEKVWPSIDTWMHTNLADTILGLLPQWMGQREKNQRKLNKWLDDPSLVNTLRNLSHTIVEKGVESINLSDFSIAQQLNERFPSADLSDEQQEALDAQSKALLEDNDTIELLTTFGKQCIEALALQLCHDLYQHYREANALEGVRHLFSDPEEDELEVASASFSTWLVGQVVEACESLIFENLTPQELKDLRRAIELKNALREAQDSEQMENDQVELDGLWVKIKPKFAHLSNHLVSILGYRKASDLPFPDKFQPAIWKTLNDMMPKVVFEQASDLMLPLLQKKELKNQVKALPEGKQIQKGCQLLAKDIVTHLPDWLEGRIDTLPAVLTESESEIELSDKAQNYLLQMVQEMVDREDPAYEPIWQWIESYMEGLFLKVAVRISHMNQQDLQKIRTLAHETKERLLALEELDDTDSVEEEDEEEEISESLEELETEEDILVEFTDQLFAWLGIETSQDLFGVPQALQEPLLKQLKAKTGQGLLGIYHLDQKVRHHVVHPNPVESKLPTSKIAGAILAVTRYALDKTTDKLTDQVNGEDQVISQIYNPLNLWLNKQAEKGYEIARLAQDAIARDVPTPYIMNLFDLLNSPSTQHYKQSFVDWVNPILTDQVIHYLTPLLEREQNEQAAFDQALVMSLLPVLTRHLKHINAASRSVDGLNIANFVDVAGDEIHPAVPLPQESEETQKEQRQDNFYKEQADLIFQLIFPNGQEDLQKILPDLELSEEQFNTVMESSKEVVAAQLPKALDGLFDREMLIEIFNGLFENVLENLDKPIEIKATKKVPLTKEAKERQRAMDQVVGELVVEVARFIDLPVETFEKLPAWAKKITGMNSMKSSTCEAIGAAIREQFNGDFLITTLQKQFTEMTKKKHVQMIAEEKAEAKVNADEHLKELERKLAERSLTFIFRYLGKRIEEATNIFKDPALKPLNALREAILAVCSFVIIDIIGTLLRFFKIDEFVINRLHDLIAHATDKSLTVFSQKELHEDAIYHGVEAVESVLLD
jgi:hypothetical protein